MENMKLQNILAGFNLKGDYELINTYTMGHINETYKVRVQDNLYVLQRINDKVFKDIDSLMYNIGLVTCYLKRAMLNNNIDYTKYTLEFLTSSNGEYYYKYNK